jgi:chemotaxis protein methyltransferase CheR
LAALELQPSGLELQLLVNAMTVNETYFFREENQFLCLVNAILPEIIAEKNHKEPIRIWVIPSSSGEEAYSIAMCLLERWPGIHQWDVTITSSDIDTKILAQAQAGLYPARSVQNVPVAYLHKYFHAVANGYQLNEDLSRAVEFTRVNLMDAEDVRYYQNFDVIFCRNLLIYFDDKSRQQAVKNLYGALRPGGFVCLGHSESMSRISSLYTVRKFPQAIVYQRPKLPL